MKKKIVFGGVGGIFLIYIGLMLYVMTDMEIEHLISCSGNQGGTRIPSSLCKYYLVNYRMNEEDIKELSEGAGLDYILTVGGSGKYELATLFLAKGLDVDGVSHYTAAPPNDIKITPLQGAALTNELQSVKFLIEQGANLQIRGELGMTALEHAKKIHKAGSEFWDRSEIIQILSDAEKP